MKQKNLKTCVISGNCTADTTLPAEYEHSKHETVMCKSAQIGPTHPNIHGYRSPQNTLRELIHIFSINRNVATYRAMPVSEMPIYKERGIVCVFV